MRLIVVLIVALPAFCCDKTRAPQFWFTLPDGDRINYEEHGTGNREVVALHGFAASLDTWRDILRFLEADFHLYLIDMKGFGLSSDVKSTNIRFSIRPKSSPRSWKNSTCTKWC